MTIEVYPSLLPGEPIERHEHAGTFGEWMRANVPWYRPGPRQPVVVEVDGRQVDPGEWDQLDAALPIAVRVKAQGAVGNFLSSVVNGLFGWLIRVPKIRTPGEGEQIKTADAKANAARLGAVIPEIAGRYRRYPDYLVPPHRYFAAEREQWIELFLCIGKGSYDIAASSIRVGDTPLISLGDDAESAIYEPGADVSGDACAVWWHSAPEVGGSGVGKAGLELTQTFDVSRTTTATSYQFSGFDVTIPAGAGSFPDGWTAGMIVRIEQYRTYLITDGGSAADVISGDLADLEPTVGMRVEIEGDNDGVYFVDSYDPGDSVTPASITLAHPDSDAFPVTSLTTGTARMAIGFDGMRYRITAASSSVITVERLDDTGATDGAWGGWDFLETADADVTLDPSTSEGDWAGPFAACPPGEVTDALELDFFLPDGLTNVSDKGKLRDHSVTVEVQWRDIATAGAWASQSFEFAGTTLDQLGYTETISIAPAMRPEVRCRVLAADDSSKVHDTVQWFGLRARLNAPASYEGVTTMSVRIRGGDRIAAQAENLISVECTRKLPVLEGDSFGVTDTATRSIASWIRHVATSIGYTDDQIDIEELSRLDAIWSARGDYYDWVQDASTVRDVINQALRAGMAEMTIDGGRIRPVRDEERSTFEHVYDPHNMTDPLRRTFDAIRPDDPDGVDVEFTDATTWSKAVVECRLPGDAGVKADKITLDGVTDRTRAWRIGMRARRAARYRRWSYEWTTELDALNSRYLSYCAVADDVPGYGKASILQAAELVDGGVLLTLSEPMEWEDGTHIVALRQSDGTLLGPYTAAAGGSDYQVIALEMPDVPDIDPSMEPPHVIFGTEERWSFPVLVTGIDPNGFESVTVSAMNYDARVYLDDNNSPD